MTDFLPGRSLPTDDRSTQERQLYHAQRTSGAWTTMSRDESIWQWRLLRGEGEDGHGRELQGWLSQ